MFQKSSSSSCPRIHNLTYSERLGRIAGRSWLQLSWSRCNVAMLEELQFVKKINGCDPPILGIGLWKVSATLYDPLRRFGDFSAKL